MAKTLDLKGREAALSLITVSIFLQNIIHMFWLQNMNKGFKKMPVSDPNDLINFIESTSGSICSIISVRNVDLYSLLHG